MMGLEEIRRLSILTALRARHHGIRPRVPTAEQREAFARGEFSTFRFPNLGDYVPAGWTLVESHFVDKLGFGLPGEPAATQSNFAHRLATLPAEHGYAMIEEGQFQCYIGEFKPKAKRAPKYRPGTLLTEAEHTAFAAKLDADHARGEYNK